MPNGQSMLTDAQMENEIREMREKGELDLWTARQVYLMSKNCAACQDSTYTKKQSNLVIGITASINAIMAFMFSRFTGGSSS